VKNNLDKIPSTAYCLSVSGKINEPLYSSLVILSGKKMQAIRIINVRMSVLDAS